MQKILVFGGTFNPMHLGHIRLYRHFAKLLRVDKTLIIPDNIPPHKDTTELISGKARLEMCRLAVQDDPTAEVSDMELLRDGESYTDITLQQLKSKYSDAQLYFVIGSDMLFMLDKWKNPQTIISLAIICTAARHPNELAALKAKAGELKAVFGGEYIIESEKVLEISSTQLRQMVRENKSVNKYLHSAVAAYIKTNRLYHNEV